MQMLEFFCQSDPLAGPLAEWRLLRERAWWADEQNAMRRVLRLASMRRPLGDDEGLRLDAERLFQALQGKAVRLVEENWLAIGRVARALADGEILTQAELDALSGAP